MHIKLFKNRIQYIDNIHTQIHSYEILPKTELKHILDSHKINREPCISSVFRNFRTLKNHGSNGGQYLENRSMSTFFHSFSVKRVFWVREDLG